MANEINIIANDTGLTVTAKLVIDGVQQGSTIALTESPFIPGFYLGSVPNGTPAGSYSVLAYSAGAVISIGTLHWLGTRELDPKNLDDLHLIHGLRNGSPLTVTPAQRTAGGITQGITQAGETVTVSRS